MARIANFPYAKRLVHPPEFAVGITGEDINLGGVGFHLLEAARRAFPVFGFERLLGRDQIRVRRQIARRRVRLRWQPVGLSVFFATMSVFLPSKDPPRKFKRVIARSGGSNFLQSAKSDRLLAQRTWSPTMQCLQ